MRRKFGPVFRKLIKLVQNELETSGFKSVLPIKLEVVIFQVKTVTILSDLRKIRHVLFLNDQY